MRVPATCRCALIVLLALGLGACASVQMQKAELEPVVREGEAMVTFMRSSFFGQAISASVYDVTGPETRFIGIVQSGTKVAYPVKPGQHTFMVVSESADFMQATVAAGRTYYVMVTPRMGMWKARFSFRPVRQGELAGSEFAGWNSATHFVVNSPESENWAASNRLDVSSKRNQYWPEWSSKPEADRASQTLNVDDGRR